MSDSLRIVAIFLIVLGNALFVGAEYAFATARRSRLEELAAQGDRRGRAAVWLARRPLRFVTTVQLGVTFLSILLGAVGAPLLERLVEPALASALAFLLALVLLTSVHACLGELVPRAIALSWHEQVALWLAPPLRVVSLALAPFAWLLERATTLLTRPLGIAPPAAGVAVATEEDIRLLVAQAEEAGVIEEAEEEMLYKVFDFADKEVRTVMVPRPAIDAIPLASGPAECLAFMTETQHVRYPVYRDTLDDLVGVLNLHDFLGAMAERGLAEVRIAELARPAHVVPETKNLGALLAEFRATGQQLAVVVDEYGILQGIATLEDLLEEIVGEIANEYELPDESLVPVGGGTFLVHGTFPIADFNELLGQQLPVEDYHTLAGFVFGLLGHAPAEGEEASWGGIRFRVVRTEGVRIVLLEAAVSGAAARVAPGAG